MIGIKKLDDDLWCDYDYLSYPMYNENECCDIYETDVSYSVLDNKQDLNNLICTTVKDCELF